jgi:hypothetical protein
VELVGRLRSSLSRIESSADRSIKSNIAPARKSIRAIFGLRPLYKNRLSGVELLSFLACTLTPASSSIFTMSGPEPGALIGTSTQGPKRGIDELVA